MTAKDIGQAAYSAGTLAVIGVGNAMAWLDDRNLGAIATAVSALGFAIFGIIAKGTPVLTAAIREVGGALAQLRAEREKFEETSLTKKVAILRAALDEARVRTALAEGRAASMERQLNLALRQIEDMAGHADPAPVGGNVAAPGPNAEG